MQSWNNEMKSSLTKDCVVRVIGIFLDLNQAYCVRYDRLLVLWNQSKAEMDDGDDFPFGLFQNFKKKALYN